jgi:hypothetical protein
MMTYKTFQGHAFVQMLAERPRPTVKAWSRLEGRPRRHDFEEALRAEVRDPLWLLARQFQLGEFLADDAGSPVSAKVQITTSQIDRFQVGTTAPQAYDPTVPLEARFERQTMSLPLSIGLQIGRRWLRLLAKAQAEGRLSSDYRPQFRNVFGVVLPEHGEAGGQVYAHESVWQLYAAAAGRCVDGAALYRQIRAGGDILAQISLNDPADRMALEELVKRLAAWVERQYGLPRPNEASAWAPQYLEYQFACSLPAFDGAGQIVLIADEYGGGHLDWYAFDHHPKLASLPVPDGSASVPAPVTRTLEFLPATIEFAGMPRVRFWEFEDRKTNFDAVRADTTDLAKLLLIDFGLIYANDWFLLPFEVPVGALCRIGGMAVTNVFGERIWIESAGSGEDDDWQRWAMYNLNTRGQNLPASTAVLIPPATAVVQESPAIEAVHLIRDEVANLVWGVEARLTLASGDVQDGFETATEFRRYLESRLPPASPGPAGATAAPLHYQLMTEVPENWIPFIPVRTAPGAGREIQLQRAAMLRTLPGQTEQPKIRPRGDLLRHNLPGAYFLHEEEVPRAGTHVRRTFQRTRWTDGRVCVWLGNRKTTGRGEGSSSLAFDRIETVASFSPRPEAWVEPARIPIGTAMSVTVHARDVSTPSPVAGRVFISGVDRAATNVAFTYTFTGSETVAVRVPGYPEFGVLIAFLPGLTIAIAPSQVVIGRATSVTVSCRNATTSSPVTGRVFINGVDRVVTNVAFTYTFTGSEVVAVRVPGYPEFGVLIAFLPGLTISIAPSQIVIGRATNVKVYCRDAVTLATVAGRVFINGIDQAATNVAFTYTFTGSEAVAVRVPGYPELGVPVAFLPGLTIAIAPSQVIIGRTTSVTVSCRNATTSSPVPGRVFINGVDRAATNVAFTYTFTGSEAVAVRVPGYPELGVPVAFLSELTIAIAPSQVVIGMATSIMVSCRNATTSSPVIGRVFINGVDRAATNVAFTYTFTGSEAVAVRVPGYPEFGVPVAFLPGLMIAIAPSQVVIGRATSVTVSCRNANTSSPVAGRVFINGVDRAAANVAFTYTFTGSETVAVRVLGYPELGVPIAFLPELTISIEPSRVIVGMATSVTVSCRNATTLAPVTGRVFTNGIYRAATNVAFTHTFMGSEVVTVQVSGYPEARVSLWFASPYYYRAGPGTIGGSQL